jgi:predicted permease
MGWFRTFFRRCEAERELDQEIQYHLEARTAHLIAAGREPEAARREALVEFGGVERAKEGCRDERSGQWLEMALQDVRYALRQLRHEPGLTTTILVTLALGIGGFTTIFSTIDGLVLHPRDLPALNEIVTLREGPARAAPGRVSFAAFLEWREATRTFDGLAGSALDGFILTGTDDPVPLVGMHVTANYFDVVGIKPMLGRGFRPEEERPGNDRVVVISYPAWQRLFNVAPDVVGRTIEMSFLRYTIIGVTPESLAPSDQVRDLWTPLPSDWWRNRTNRFSDVFGRLKPGVTLAQAQAEMDALANAVAAKFPDSHAGWKVNLTPRRELLAQRWVEWLWTLLGAAACLLLIACANVANLLLARATARQREMAVRAALGASRARLVRQLLTESLLLSLAGGAAGAMIAAWGVDSVRHLAPIFGFEQLSALKVGVKVLGFALLVSVITGVVFGVAPAWLAAQVDLRTAMSAGTRGSAGAGGTRLRRALVVAEVALALVLLNGAGLLAQSFVRLMRADPGFVADHAIAIAFDMLKGDRYETPARQMAFIDGLLAKINALPEVQTVGATSQLSLGGLRRRTFDYAVKVEGREAVVANAAPRTARSTISPDYFRAMGMRLVRGRTFDAHDTETAPRVTIVNETFARQNFPGEDPLGRRVDSNLGWAEIAGIVADSAPGETDRPMFAQMFDPHTQRGGKTWVVVARTRGDPALLGAALVRQVRVMDKDQPVYAVTTLDQAVSYSYALQRFSMVLPALFSLVALLLAAVGLYGVMAYMVTQRRVEIGIRIALGGQMRDIIRLVMGEGGRLVGLGLVLGLVAAFGAGRLIESRLFRTSAYDPGTLAGIALFFSAVAALACWLPARRASRIDPIVALRSE